MMDKLLDFFVGDSPSKSFALICKKCKAHNGLAPIEEMDSIRKSAWCDHYYFKSN